MFQEGWAGCRAGNFCWGDTQGSSRLGNFISNSSDSVEEHPCVWPRGPPCFPSWDPRLQQTVSRPELDLSSTN